MSKYKVIGFNWDREVEIDDSNFSNDEDAHVEAATRILEDLSSFEKKEILSEELFVYNKEAERLVIVPTHICLANAGKYDAAEIFHKQK